MSNNKSKLTLIIDGNWLLMSRYSVLVRKFPDEHELGREIQKLMLKSIMLVLKQFTFIDNIIFVSDCGSWRTDIDIPQFIIEEKSKEDLPFEYKGQRKLPDDVDWKIIFDYYDELIDLLNSNNITTCKESNIEGDDWCWYWSNKLNKEGTNAMIWSMDKDLTQLVNYNKSNYVFTVCWNDKTGLFIPILEEDPDDIMNFFFTNLNKQENINLFDSICDKCVKITKVNPKEVIIDKIIRGDKGDNIFPIILKNSNKQVDGESTKKYRIGKKDIDFDLDINSESEIRTYIHKIMSSKKYMNKVVNNKTENDVYDHFKYNYKLIVLEEKNYPKEILELMKKNPLYMNNIDIPKIFQYLSVKNDKSLNTMLESI